MLCTCCGLPLFNAERSNIKPSSPSGFQHANCSEGLALKRGHQPTKGPLKPQPKSQSKSQSKSQPKFQPKSQSKAKTEPKLEPKLQTKIKSKIADSDTKLDHFDEPENNDKLI